MDASDRPRPKRRFLPPFFVGLLLLGSLVSLGAGVSSLAIWTDTDTTTGSFTAGTVDLAVSPATILTVTGIAPGQSGSAALTVTNSGTLAVRYAMTSSSTNTDSKNLRGQLLLTISTGACPGSTALFGPAAINGALFGDPTQGANTGDRTLAAAASEVLCFAWSLPSSTGDAFQGSTTTTTFTFAAEQTVANP
jgi:predicted ribosomally synthesized peptide with SipW-like signal peptide